MKNREPANVPRMICHSCGSGLKRSEKWMNNNQGQIFCVHIDVWPEYFWDQPDTTRLEFCNPKCVLDFIGSCK